MEFQRGQRVIHPFRTIAADIGMKRHVGLRKPGELAIAADPQALTDRLNLIIAAGQLSAATLATIRTTLAGISVTTTAGSRNRVQAGVLLVLAAPEYIAQK